MNEETILESQDNKKNLNDEKETIKMDNTNKKGGLGTAGVAGIAGVTGAAAGIMIPIDVYPANTESDEIEGENGTVISSTDTGNEQEWSEIPIATNVDDSMSFNEAFAAARHEVGAGGVFVWHGHAYNTYYAEEWSSMSQEDQNQYFSDVSHTLSHNQDNNENQDNPNDYEIHSDVNNGELGEQVQDPDDPNIVDPDPLVNFDPDTDLYPLDHDSLNPDPNYVIDQEDSSLSDPGFDTEEYLEHENSDIDEFSSNDIESDIAIDNNMNMEEFV